MGSAIKRVANYAVSNTAYGAGWDGVTDVAPSKNAVYDKVELLAPKANPTFSGLITTAGQIKFPATQNASSDANTLDDYEEGTWTPSYTPESGSWDNMVYSARVGVYKKIGSLVWVRGIMYMSAVSIGTASGILIVGGLPFALSDDNDCLPISMAINWTTAPAVLRGYYGNGFVVQHSLDGTSSVAALLTGSGSLMNLLYFSGCYSTT